MNEEIKRTTGEDRITVQPGEFIPTYSTDIHSETPEERKQKFENLRKQMLGTQSSTLEQPVARTVKYYRLPLPPYTIFKLDQDNFTSYKFDQTKQCWIEFPEFFTDFEHGNIRVEEIQINDGYPTIKYSDQSKGMKL